MKKAVSFIGVICPSFSLLAACGGTNTQKTSYLEDENVRPDITKMIFYVSSDEANINLNKVKITPPYKNENGTVFVPLKVLCDNLGAEAKGDSLDTGIEIKSTDSAVLVLIDKSSITVNGKTVSGVDAHETVDGETMVPIETVAAALGAEVRYDAEKDRVIVDKRRIRKNWQVNNAMLDEIKAFVLKKTAENAPTYKRQIPHATDENGKYKLMDNPGWVAGFYTGLNYICYDWSGDEKYVGYAKEVFPMLKNYLRIKPEFYHHDLGFTFMLSYYRDYLLNGTESSKKVVIDAADVLMGRFTDAGYIRGWNVWGDDEFARNNQYRMICDSMCNILILFTASELTGDKKYYDAAVSQADLTIKYLIRDDFTTTHTFLFYPDGSPRGEQQYQGAYDTSCWSRGHAWVINGMAQAYKYTKDERYLQAAKDLADTYLLMTDDDLIPHWDFVYKGNDGEPRDASAAAIIACGLCDIYDATDDEFYKDTAYKILCELYVNYSSSDEPDNQGLINHATGNKPQHQNIDVSLIYGDYYFAQLTDRFCAADK